MKKGATTEESILKYLQVLKDLKLILDNTSRLSINDFCKKQNVTTNLGVVLRKGGIIKLIQMSRGLLIN